MQKFSQTLATALTSVLALMVAASVAVAGLTHDAPEGGYSAMGPVKQYEAKRTNDEKPINLAGRQNASEADRVQCQAKSPSMRADGSPEFIPSALLVTDREGNVERKAFTEENIQYVRSDGHIRVIGFCR